MTVVRFDSQRIASSPVSRLGLQRKFAELLRALSTSSGTPSEAKTQLSVRDSFDQMREDWGWAWEHFRTDTLAREICWRLPIAADRLCGELLGGSGKKPTSRLVLIQMCERGIEAAQLLADKALRDRIQCALASRAAALHIDLNDDANGAKFLGFAHAIADGRCNAKLAGRILSLDAELFVIRQDWASARNAFLRASDLAHSSGDGPALAVASFGIGKVCRVLGDRLESAEWLGRALQYSRDLSLRDLAFKIIQELGVLWMSLEEYGPAIRCYEEAVNGTADPLSRGRAKLALGEAWLAAGSDLQAQKILQDAETDARTSGDRTTLEQIHFLRGKFAKCAISGHIDS